MSQPFIPSDVWFIIFEYTVGHSLSKEGVNELYYYNVFPKHYPANQTNLDFSISPAIQRIAYLDTGIFNKENNRRRGRLLHMRRLRLVCTRFARIMPRVPPDYLFITKQVYKDSSYIVTWCKYDISYTHRHYTAIILGILWAFFRIKVDVFYNRLNQPYIAFDCRDKYGMFRVIEKFGLIEIFTPMGDFECHFHGLSLKSRSNINDRPIDIPTNFDYLIEKCMMLCDI
jgi:hypothetical protein